MNAKEIKDLISFISASGLSEVNLETDNIKLSVKRAPGSIVYTEPTVVAPPAVMAQPATAQPSAPVAAPSEPVTAAPEPAPAQTAVIKSPMIGTFYRSSSPDAPPFKSVGDPVKKGDVVCIIEAMKLFNEIESEVTGKIIKVLVDNASPVEYDQPLFLVQL